MGPPGGGGGGREGSLCICMLSIMWVLVIVVGMEAQERVELTGHGLLQVCMYVQVSEVKLHAVILQVEGRKINSLISLHYLLELTTYPACLTARGMASSPVPTFPFSRWMKV